MCVCVWVCMCVCVCVCVCVNQFCIIHSHLSIGALHSASHTQTHMHTHTHLHLHTYTHSTDTPIEQFIKDVHLMYTNAMRFNRGEDPESTKMRALSNMHRDHFEDLLLECGGESEWSLPVPYLPLSLPYDLSFSLSLSLSPGGDKITRDARRKARDDKLKDMPIDRHKIGRVLNKLTAKGRVGINHYFMEPVDEDALGIKNYFQSMCVCVCVCVYLCK